MAVTLRELLTDLVGAAATHADGPAAYLAAHGYDLPPDLVAEAVVNFADTTSPEVAEHLAPFVTAHTTGVEPESDWFDLLTTAPVPEDDPDDVDDLDSDPGLDFGAGAVRSEEHTSELQSRPHLVCRLLLDKKKNNLFLPFYLKKKKHNKKP